MTYLSRKSVLPLSLLIPFGLTGQEATKPPATQVQVSRPWLDHYRVATWSIGRVSKDRNTNRDFFEVVGTGVVVSFEKSTGYLVTAKHVFFEPEKHWDPSEVRLRFALQEQKSVFDELGIILRLKDDHGNILWKSPDDGSDLAAIKLPPIPAQVKDQSIDAIAPTDFATDADLYQGANIIVLGYPGVVGNEYLVRAIVRQGIVAWTNPIDPMNNTFLVDSNVFPGNSGSPVFRFPSGLSKEGSFSLGGTVRLLGILSKGPLQDAPVMVDGQPLIFQNPAVQQPAGDHSMKVQLAGIGGIGVIEPASKVLKLLTSLNDQK